MNIENENPELVYPYGKPEITGRLKQNPEDFKVTENLGFSLSGQGEHLFLYVQKINLTTHQLIEQLAKVTGIQQRHIGYSGLKDKNAITRQWVSLHMPGAKQKPEIHDTENYQILDSDWNDKKLRVGAHRSNSFEIIIRDIEGDTVELDKRLEHLTDQIQQQGFANYFGEQRFGRQQDNVEQAIRVLNNRHKLKRLSRNKKSLYISALRSELYNQILSQRIERGIWEQPLGGDAFLLAGTQSVFTEPLTDELRSRYTELDIHCGISLYGTGESRVASEASNLEHDVIDKYPEIKSTLEHLEIKRSLRANRAEAKKLSIKYLEESAEIKLSVELEKGVYLTELVNHLVKIQ